MRLVIALVLLALAAPLALAQGATVRATTEDGRHILVHPGGTWVIDPDPDGPMAEIELDLTQAVPPPAPAAGTQRQTLTSASGAYAIEYDADTWRRPPSRADAESEFELQLPFGAAYAMTIYEAYPTTSKDVRDLVVANAEAGTVGGVTILSERPLVVPGGSGIQIEFQGRAENGVEIRFITSAFGTEYGALQVATFTAASNADRYRDTMRALHEGIRLTKPGR